ncbi:hypothetical protein NEOC84_001384|nr:hypothetical protein [Neochlamydia sp. AcF95]NGY95464.1 hypothetical protein [Neochlamydia sp. AcF84]
MAFDQSSLRWFEISSCKATSRSHFPHLSYSYAHLKCARGTQKLANLKGCWQRHALQVASINFIIFPGSNDKEAREGT